MARDNRDGTKCKTPKGAVAPPDPDVIRAAIEAAGKGARAKWWRRRGSKRRGFWYEDAAGGRVTDDDALARIKSLVLPPGWLDARVNPKAGGRIQAVGVDTCGRLQYRYHPSFTARRQEAKYSKLVRFGERLPLLRARAEQDLSRNTLDRERVLAAVTRIINHLYIRVGSDNSVRRYRTFGVTTLQNRHVSIERGGRLVFNYIGKHHIRHRRILLDPELAAMIRDLKSVGGARLFNYVDSESRSHPLKPADVNRYIRAAMGAEFSSKDFRTWHGTLLAAEALAAAGPAESERAAKRQIVAALRSVAERLGNTPTVCRNCYVHPIVLDAYRRGVTLDSFCRNKRRVVSLRQSGLDDEERRLLELLRTGGYASTEQPCPLPRAA